MKQRLEAFLKGAIEGLTGEMRLEPIPDPGFKPAR